MKVTDELRSDGSTRFRVQHKDPARPGKYTTRRWDDERDAKEFVRRAKLGLNDAIAWDDERRGGVSFRGQAGRTFADYARSYIESQSDIKRISRDKMESRLRTIERVPQFADLQMGAITATDVDVFKRELSKLTSPRDNGVLKSRSKNLVLALVRSVIRHAVSRRDIPHDVTLGIKSFRVDDARATCPITVDEFDSILIHITPARRPLFRLLLDSGLRISEALSLRWQDINETAQGIYAISVYGEDDTQGKTRNAQRVTTIPPETFKMLAHVEDDRVFTDPYFALSAEWRRAVQRAQSTVHATEFPVLAKSPTIHDLRHTHAAYLITSCGFNLVLVAERLGHRDIGITQRYYGRLVTEQAHELGVSVARNIPRGVVE